MCKGTTYTYRPSYPDRRVVSSHDTQEQPDEEDEHDEHLDDDAAIATHYLVIPDENRRQEQNATKGG